MRGFSILFCSTSSVANFCGHSLTALVNIANALTVTVDDLLYDSIVHARPQLERDIQQIVDSCDDYELRVVKEVTQSVVDALRANDKLRNEL